MTHKNASKTKLPIWLWLLTGLALAGLIMFLILLNTLQPPQYTPAYEEQNNTVNNDQTESPLDFYYTLKNTVIPAKTDNNSEKTKKIVDKYVYLLQVASFRDLSDAKQVQAELILLGISSSIEKSKNSNGNVWHRIIAGPFKNRSEQQGARSKLLANNYSPMQLKRKDNKKN